MKHIVGFLLILSGVCVTVGCSSYTELAPAPADKTVEGLGGTAVDTVEGVQVSADGNAWTGRADVTDVVTPLKVSIRNHSGAPIQIRYTNFALIDPSGKRYSALPPYRIEGTIEQPLVTSHFNPIKNPAISQHGFLVAPFYQPMYPGITPSEEPFYIDPFYYDRYYRYWEEIRLPTPEMLDQAMPEGTLQEKGEVSGFLYFEKVGKDEPRVRFRADLVDSATGRRFGTVSIPFLVRK